jgi:hypothetical protein
MPDEQIPEVDTADALAMVHGHAEMFAQMNAPDGGDDD